MKVSCLMEGMVVEDGVVVELDGKFWGKTYDDGRSTSYGWTDIKRADMGDERYCVKPEDKTYKGSHYTDELKKGKIVRIRRLTSYVVRQD